jgi:hypothetical protein
MRDVLEDLKRLPIRARAAIGLSATDRSMELIRGIPHLAEPAANALMLAWGWVEGKDVSARQIYNHIHPLNLLLQENDDLAKKYQAPIRALLYGLYYTTWHARGHEIATNDVKYDRPLPNDITDVTEKTLDECLNEIRHVLSKEEWNAWLERVTTCLRATSEDGFEDLGTPIPRSALAAEQ